MTTPLDHMATGEFDMKSVGNNSFRTDYRCGHASGITPSLPLSGHAGSVGLALGEVGNHERDM